MIDDIYIKTPHGTIFGKHAGNPTHHLVLGIHGWSRRNGWQTWAPFLEPLAKAGYYAVTVDMPAWGKSPAWQNISLRFPANIVLIIITLLNALEADVATLMGKSWGGGVAFETALAYPKRIDRLILTAPVFRSIKRLAGFPQPVLMAWAKDDWVVPIRNVKKYIQIIPTVQIEEYEKGGHSAAMNNVDDFAAKAIQFLQT